MGRGASAVRFRLLLNIDSNVRQPPTIVPVPGATAPGIDPRHRLHRVLPDPPPDDVELWVESDELPPFGQNAIGTIIGWDQTWPVRIRRLEGYVRVDMPLVRLRHWELVVEC